MNRTGKLTILAICILLCISLFLGIVLFGNFVSADFGSDTNETNNTDIIEPLTDAIDVSELIETPADLNVSDTDLNVSDNQSINISDVSPITDVPVLDSSANTSENDALTESTESNASIIVEAEIIKPSVIVEENLTYEKVSINHNVKWTKRVYVNNSNRSGRVEVNLPKYALITNVSTYDNETSVKNKSLKGKSIKNKNMERITYSHKRNKFSADTNTSIVSVDTANNSVINIEYQTPGPRSEIEEVSLNKKIVKVISEEHFENVDAYVDIPKSKLEDISLYWIEQGIYLNFSGVDNDNDGLYEGISFVIPHLSNQTFEVSLNIINVHSYPILYGLWRVEFATTGTNDLYIYGINTTFNQDLEFVELYCGDSVVAVEVVDNGFLARNFNCESNAYFVSKELSIGEHHLEFTFGDKIAYAHNYASSALKYISRRVIGTGSYILKFLSTNTTSALSLNIFGLTNGTSNHTVSCSSPLADNYWTCTWSGYALGAYTIQSNATPTDELNVSLNVTQNALTAFLQAADGLTYVIGGSDGALDCVMVSVNGVNQTVSYSPIYNDTTFNLTVNSRYNLSMMLEYNSTAGYNRTIFNISPSFINPDYALNWSESEDASLAGTTYAVSSYTGCTGSCVRLCAPLSTEIPCVLNFTLTNTYSGNMYLWIRASIKESNWNIPSYTLRYYNGSAWSSDNTISIGTAGSMDVGSTFYWSKVPVYNVSIIQIEVTPSGLDNEHLYVDSFVLTNESLYNATIHGNYVPKEFSVLINSSNGDVWQNGYFNSTKLGNLSDYTAPPRLTDVRVCSLFSNSTGGFNYSMNISGSNNISINAYYGDTVATKNFTIINGVVFDSYLYDGYGQSDYVVGLGERINVTVTATMLGAAISNMTISLNNVNHTMNYSNGEYFVNFTSPSIPGEYNLTYNIFVGGIFNTSYSSVLHVRNITSTFSVLGSVVSGQPYSIIGNISDGYDNNYLGTLNVGGSTVLLSNSYITQYSYDGVSWNNLDTNTYYNVYLRFLLNGSYSSPIIETLNTGSGLIEFNDSAEFTLYNTSIKKGRLQLVDALLYNDSLGDMSAGVNFSIGDNFNKYYGAIAFNVTPYGVGGIFNVVFDSNNWFNINSTASGVAFYYKGAGSLSSGSCTGSGFYLVNYGSGILNVSLNGTPCLSMTYTEMNNSVRANITIGGSFILNNIATYDRNVNISSTLRVIPRGSAISVRTYNVSNYGVVAYNYGNNFYVEKISSGFGVQPFNLTINSSYGLSSNFSSNYSATTDIYAPVIYNLLLSDPSPMRFTIPTIDAEFFDHTGLSNVTLWVNTSSGFYAYKTLVLNGHYDYARFFVDTTPWSKETVVQYYLKYYDNASNLSAQTPTQSFTVISPYRITINLSLPIIITDAFQFVSGMFTRMSDVIFVVSYPNSMVILNESSLSGLSYARDNETLSLGKKNYYTYDNWSGTYEDVVIIDSQIKPDIATNLVSYWSFDGSNASKENSGHGYDIATNYGSATLINNCSIGNCYLYNGINDNLRSIPFSIPNNDGKVTITAWLNPYPMGAFHSFLYSEGTSSTGYINAFYNSARYRVGYANGSANYDVLFSGYFSSGWQFTTVTVDFNTKNFKLYKNNTFFGNLTGTADVMVYPSTSSNKYISGGFGFWNGSIDDVRIYNSELSLYDISKLFARDTRSGRYTSPIFNISGDSNTVLRNLTLSVSDIGNSSVLVQTRFATNLSNWSSWYPDVYDDNRIYYNTTFYHGFDNTTPYCASGCNLIIENNTVNTSGVVNNATYFNGLTSYQSYNNSFLNSTEGTIEFWINTSNLSRTQGILDTGKGIRFYVGKVPTDGLVAWWKLDEYNSTLSYEYSGNNITCANMASNCNIVPGIKGNALFFDGVNDKATINTKVDISNYSTWSISLWMNPSLAINGYMIGDTLAMDSSRTIYEYSDGATHNSAIVVPLYSWSNIVVTCVNSTNNLSFYYNGVYTNSVTVNCSYNSASRVKYLGSFAGATSYNFNGALDDVMIYNRSLSSEEIKTIYYINMWVCHNGTSSKPLIGYSNLSNQYSHVAFSYTNQSANIYLNGDLVAKSSSIGCLLNQTGNNITIGKSNLTNFSFSFIDKFGTSGTGTNYISSPGCLFDNGTYLYICSGPNRILKLWSSNLSYISQFGGLSYVGNGTDQMNGPASIWSDDVYVYIADTGNNRIVKRWASNWSYVSQIGSFGTGNDNFNSPYGVWGDGIYIYIADRNNYRIVKRWASNLSYVSKIGSIGSGNDQFNQPMGVWGINGYIYVTDWLNHRVVQRNATDLSYVSQGGTMGSGDGQIMRPIGIWGDGTYLYIADYYNHRIDKWWISNYSFVAKVGAIAGNGNDQFTFPMGIGGHDNILFVTDSSNNRVHMRNSTDLSYIYMYSGGLIGGNDSYLSAPMGIWSDGTYLYVSDYNNHRIVKRNATDLSYVSQTGYYGTGNDSFNYPTGIWSDGTYLYIADRANNRIVKRNATDLSFVSKIGSYGTGNDQFYNPYGVWGDGTYLYISDRSNDRIVKRWASNLSYVSSFSSNNPYGVWGDGTYLYVTDTTNNRIVKRWASNFSVVLTNGSLGSGIDNFNNPTGIWGDGTYLYIADYSNNRIMKRWASNLSYVSIIGYYGTGDYGFYNPWGIWSDGINMYISDLGNNRIVIRSITDFVYFQGSIDSLRISNRSLERFELSYWNGLNSTNIVLPYTLSNGSNYLQYRVILRKNNASTSTALTSASINYVNNSQYESTGYAESNVLSLGEYLSINNLFNSKTEVTNQTEVHVQVRLGRNNSGTLNWSSWIAGEPKNNYGTLLLETFNNGSVYGTATDYSIEQGYTGYGLGLGYRNYAALSEGGNTSTGNIYVKGTAVYNSSSISKDTTNNYSVILSLDFTDPNIETTGNYYNLNITNLSIANGIATFNRNSSIIIHSPAIDKLENNFAIHLRYNTTDSTLQELFTLYPGLRFKIDNNNTPLITLLTNDNYLYPIGVWSDGTYVYIVDNSNNRIVKRYISNFSYVSSVPYSVLGLVYPSGICGDDSYLYVSSVSTNSIFKISANDLSYVSTIGTQGSGNDQFNSPYGVYTDGTYLYIADTANNRIVKRWASNLSYVAQNGTSGTGNDNFNNPRAIWGDGAYLYVADTNNNRIVKRNATDLSYVSKIGSIGSGNDQFSSPRGVWADSTYIYVVDTTNNRIVKRWASNLSYVSQIGSSGSGNDQFSSPVGVWGDGAYLYVADTNNNRIVKRNATDLSYVSQNGYVGSEYVYRTNWYAYPVPGSTTYGVSITPNYVYLGSSADYFVEFNTSTMNYVGLVGSIGSGNDQYNNPYDSFSDGTYVYVGDFGNYRIVKRWASNFSYITNNTMPVIDSALWSDGTYVYVANQPNDRIDIYWASNLSYYSTFGSFGTGNDNFNNPTGIWGDGTYLYIADSNNDRVVKRLASNYSYVSQATGITAALRITGDGNYLYVLEYSPNNLKKIRSSDMTLLSTISLVYLNIMFPSGINYYNNNIYVSDLYGHVSVVDPDTLELIEYNANKKTCTGLNVSYGQFHDYVIAAYQGNISLYVDGQLYCTTFLDNGFYPSIRTSDVLELGRYYNANGQLSKFDVFRLSNQTNLTQLVSTLNNTNTSLKPETLSFLDTYPTIYYRNLNQTKTINRIKTIFPTETVQYYSIYSSNATSPVPLTQMTLDKKSFLTVSSDNNWIKNYNGAAITNPKTTGTLFTSYVNVEKPDYDVYASTIATDAQTTYVYVAFNLTGYNLSQFSKIRLRAYGYGSGWNGSAQAYNLSIAVWNNTASSWLVLTTSTQNSSMQTIADIVPSFSSLIDANNTLFMAVYPTYPANSLNSVTSKLAVDYVALSLIPSTAQIASDWTEVVGNKTASGEVIDSFTPRQAKWVATKVGMPINNWDFSEPPSPTGNGLADGWSQSWAGQAPVFSWNGGTQKIICNVSLVPNFYRCGISIPIDWDLIGKNYTVEVRARQSGFSGALSLRSGTTVDSFTIGSETQYHLSVGTNWTVSRYAGYPLVDSSSLLITAAASPVSETDWWEIDYIKLYPSSTIGYNVSKNLSTIIYSQEIYDAGQVSYNATRYVNATQGTIEFWSKPKLNYDSYWNSAQAIFHFEELNFMAGVNVTDSSPRNRSGLISGSNAFSRPGVVNNGVYFCDLCYSNGHSITAYNISASTKGLTFAGWFKVNSIAEQETLFASTSTNAPYMWIMYQPSGAALVISYSFTNSTFGGITSNNYVSTSQWIFATIVFDYENKKVILYKNGTRITDSNISAIYPQQNMNIYIGRYPNPAYYFNGTMDDIYIFNTSLTDAEVKSLYSRSNFVQTNSTKLITTLMNSTPNEWHHYAITYDNSIPSFTIWKDGVIQETVNTAINLTGATTLLFENQEFQSNLVLDNLHISNYSKSQYQLDYYQGIDSGNYSSDSLISTSQVPSDGQYMQYRTILRTYNITRTPLLTAVWWEFKKTLHSNVSCGTNCYLYNFTLPIPLGSPMGLYPITVTGIGDLENATNSTSFSLLRLINSSSLTTPQAGIYYAGDTLNLSFQGYDQYSVPVAVVTPDASISIPGTPTTVTFQFPSYTWSNSSISVPIGTQITIINGVTDTRIFSCDLFSQSIASGNNYTFYADTAGVHTVGVSGFVPTLTINVTTSNEIPCTNYQQDSNGVITCNIDTTGLTTPYNYNVKVNLTKTNYQAYQKIYHDVFTMYSRSGTLTLDTPTVQINGTSYYTFNDTLTVRNTGGGVINNITVYNTVNQGFTITPLSTNCTSLDVRQNCTSTFNISIPLGANIQDYILYWRVNYTDLTGSRTSSLYSQTISIQQTPKIESNVSSMTLNVSHNSITTRSLLLNTSGNVDLAGVTITYTGDLNVTFNPSSLSNTYRSNPETINMTITVPYRQYAGLYQGYINMSGNSPNPPYPYAENIIPINITVLTDHNYTITPSSLDIERQMNYPSLISTFNVTNYGNVNESLIFNITQRASDYDDIKNSSNPAVGSLINVSINGQTSFDLRHVAYFTDQYFYFNVSVGTVNSTVILHIRDLPPILSNISILNPPIELGAPSTVRFLVSDEQPAQLNLTCNYSMNGSSASVTATQSFGYYNCVYTPLLEGTYNVTIIARDYLGQSSNYSMNMATIGSTTLSASATTSPNAYNVGLYVPENITINFTVNNTGSASGLNLTVSTPGYTLYMDLFNISRNQSSQKNFTLTVPAGKVSGTYNIPITLQWTNRNGSVSNTTFTATFYVQDNPLMQITGVPSDITLQHGTSQNYTLNITSIGNADLADILLEEVFSSLYNITFYDIFGTRNNYISAIAYGTSTQVIMQVTALIGSSGSGLSTNINVTSNTDAVQYPITINIPQNFSYATLSNITIIDSHSKNTTILIPINNTGNINRVFTFSIINLSNVTVNSSFSITKQTSANLSMNYLTPDYDTNLSGFLNVSYVTGYDLIPIYIRVIPAQFNVTNVSHTSIDKTKDTIFNFTTNVSVNNVIVTNNLTFTAAFSSYDCVILNSTFNVSDSLWYTMCQIPTSITDGVNHTLIVSATDANSGITLTDTSRLVYFEDTTAPVITNVTTGVQTDGSFLSLGVTATDNVGIVNATVYIPRTNETLELTQVGNDYITSVIEGNGLDVSYLGDYQAIFTLKDARNNTRTQSTTFGIYRMRGFSGTLKDYTNTPFAATFILRDPITGTNTTFSTNINGYYSQNLYAKPYDMTIRTRNYVITLNNFSLMNASNPFISFDELPKSVIPLTSIVQGSKGLVVRTSSSGSGNIVINYSALTIEYEQYLEVFKCAKWNETDYSCGDTWWSQLPKSKDLLNKLITASISDVSTGTNSAIYVIVENVPAPAPIVELVNTNNIYTTETATAKNLTLYINSAGEENLRNVKITCTSTLCSTFNFSSETRNQVNPLTPNIPIYFSVYVPKGYAAGNYTTSMSVESNANTVSGTFTFEVPESTSVSVTPTSNISIESGTGMRGILTTLTVSNDGNKDTNVNYSATHNFMTFPTDTSMRVLDVVSVPVNYTMPDALGYYTGSIYVNSIAIPYALNITSNVVMQTINPSSDLRPGDVIRVEFEAYNRSVMMTNDTLTNYSITVADRPCNILISSYTTYFTAWCQLPDIGEDLANYTLRVITPFAVGQQQIFYRDLYGPSITSIDSSSLASGVTYINFSLYDTSGVGAVSVDITSDGISIPINTITSDVNTPDTNVIIDLGGNNYRIKTSANTIGDYNLTFTTRDINNYASTTSKSYEIFEYFNLSGSIKNMYGSYVPALFRFYNPITGSVVSSLQHTGVYSTTSLHRRAYRMYIESFSAKSKIYLDNVDLRNNISDLFNMTELDLSRVGVVYTGGVAKNVYGVGVQTPIVSSGNLSLTYSPATAGVENSQNVYMFKCDNFDFSQGTCNSSFVQINQSTAVYNQDGTQTITAPITSFSAYLLTELRPQGSIAPPTTITTTSSGGGGGGGSTEEISSALRYISSSLNNSNNSNIELDTTEIKRELYIGEHTAAKIRLTNSKNTNESLTVKISVSEDLKKFINFSKTEVILNAKEEAIIDLDIHADYDVKKGLYTGSIVITSDEGNKNLPVELRVYESNEFATTINVEMLNPKITPGNQIKAQFDINYPSSIPTNFTYTIEAYDSFSEQKIYDESGYIYITGPTNLFREINTTKSTKLGSYVLKITLVEKNRKLDYKKTATFEIVQPFLEMKFLSIKMRYYLNALEIIAAIALLVLMYRGLRAYQESKKRYHLMVDRRELPEPSENTMFIGNLAETNVRTFLEILQMRTHTIIAGTTGGGKSVTGQVFVEEALDKNVGVIVFDPTAQWSGFLRKLTSKQMMQLYEQFGMKPSDARSFNGNVYSIEDPLEIIDIKKHIQPGEIHIFTTQKLTPAQMDIFVANTVRQVFVEGFDETPNLRGLIVYDEVHRLLPKFGGSGEGFLQIERACREFRKWGLGVVLISQVLSDFVGEIKANITTEVQMRTRDEGDLERLKNKYGEEVLQALVKAVAGTGMIENPSYNKGKPYLVTFRPLKHSIERLSDADLALYNKYNGILDEYEYQIEQLKELNYDTFDLELEHRLSMQKVKSGQFNMVDIYLESLVPAFESAWKSLNKTPKKKQKKLADIKDVKKSIQEAQKAREKVLKEEKEKIKDIKEKLPEDITNQDQSMDTSDKSSKQSSDKQNSKTKPDVTQSVTPPTSKFKEDLIAGTSQMSGVVADAEAESSLPGEIIPQVLSGQELNAALETLKALNSKLEAAKAKKDANKMREAFDGMKNIIGKLPNAYQKKYAPFISAYDAFFNGSKSKK